MSMFIIYWQSMALSASDMNS